MALNLIDDLTDNAHLFYTFLKLFIAKINDKSILLASDPDQQHWWPSNEVYSLSF
jgi:hypothetical protein